MISGPPTRASRSCMPNRPSPRSRERIMSSTSKRSGEVVLRVKHHAPRKTKRTSDSAVPAISSRATAARFRHQPPPAVHRSRERRRVGPECVAWSETAQLAVLLRVALPLIGHGALMENGVDGAFGFACAALDALIGVDVVHVRRLVNARDRADIHAAGVFLADARLNDHVGHRRFFPRAQDATRRAVLTATWVTFRTPTRRAGVPGARLWRWTAATEVRTVRAATSPGRRSRLAGRRRKRGWISARRGLDAAGPAPRGTAR